jgi:formylglycine-generating enzyme required for sulfatase activity
MAKKSSSKTEPKVEPKKEVSVQIWVAIIGLIGTILTLIVTMVITLIENNQLKPAKTPIGFPTGEETNNILYVGPTIDAITGCPAGMVPVDLGDFLMGPDPLVEPEETQKRKIYLDKFCIHEREVSVGEYESYLARRNLVPSPELHALHPDYPAVYITWEDAEDYCSDYGYKLPTEAQWEKAARGTDGRTFPWGNTPWNPNLANCCQAPPEGLKPVGEYQEGRSPYSVLNMAGNAAEWVADWYMKDWYAISEELRNPLGPEFNDDYSKVVRGGDYFSSEALVRVTARNGAYNLRQPSEDLRAIGFRCVYNPPPNP